MLSTPNRSRVLRQAATTGSAPLFHGTGENLLAITGFTSLKLRLNRPIVIVVKSYDNEDGDYDKIDDSSTD